MLRTGAPRSLLRTTFLTKTPTPAIAPAKTAPSLAFRSQLATLTPARRPHLQVTSITRPSALQAQWHLRGASSSTEKPRQPIDTVDTQHEQEIAAQKLEAHPELVSSDSSMISVSTPASEAAATEEQEPKMMAGIYSDLAVIRETFSLTNVPRQAYYMGLAGVLPYMATSLSTVYCAWEINHAAETGTGLFLDERLAEQALHIIEPLQVGYGAVILSFLGAIHWGLEWAQYGGVQGYPRYMIGVVTTAIAWPTLLFPVEYALITQFLAFTFLYYTDVRAKTRGWTPQWYGIYRFTLTFIVGASIIISLIGRGQIADRIGRKHTTADKIREFGEYHPGSDEELDAQETRRKYLGDEGGDEEDEEDDEEEEDDDE